MELVKLGETKQLKTKNGTFDGINLTVKLVASQANEPIILADAFIPEDVSFRSTLQYGKEIELFNETLKTINLALNQNKLESSLVGYIKKPHGVGIKAELNAQYFIPFGGHIRTTDINELMAEITLPVSGVFDSSIDKNLSSIVFSFRESVGYFTHIPLLKFKNLAENTETQKFYLGNRIVSLMLLNTSSPNYQNPNVKTLSLTTDKINFDFNYDDLIAHDERFRQRTSVLTEQVLPNPQTFILFDRTLTNSLPLNNVNLSIKLENKSYAESNTIAYMEFYTDAVLLQAANNRRAKHSDENRKSIF